MTNVELEESTPKVAVSVGDSTVIILSTIAGIIYQSYGVDIIPWLDPKVAPPVFIGVGIVLKRLSDKVSNLRISHPRVLRRESEEELSDKLNRLRIHVSQSVRDDEARPILAKLDRVWRMYQDELASDEELNAAIESACAEVRELPVWQERRMRGEIGDEDDKMALYSDIAEK